MGLSPGAENPEEPPELRVLHVVPEQIKRRGLLLRLGTRQPSRQVLRGAGLPEARELALGEGPSAAARQSAGGLPRRGRLPQTRARVFGLRKLALAAERLRVLSAGLGLEFSFGCGTSARPESEPPKGVSRAYLERKIFEGADHSNGRIGAPLFEETRVQMRRF